MARKRSKRREYEAAEAPVLRVRTNRHHVAQEYQDNRSLDIAYELVRHLVPRHRRAVIGPIRRPEVAR